MRRRIHACEEEDTCTYTMCVRTNGMRRIHAYEEEDTCI
jgi:hypothetical protein